MNLDKNKNVSSNRSFGLMFFVVFLIVALWPLNSGENLRLGSLVISIVFFILGIFNSRLLSPFNKLWFKFGIFLGSIISPIVMAVIYFIVVTPTGMFMRLLGKDLLRTRETLDVSTYWIKPDKRQSTMKNQF
jgi:hypothetical protein|tara:strand:+ start:691 stop:1086 length:396 start_codon:yes stop_codon:yes gene_type:complete